MLNNFKMILCIVNININIQSNCQAFTVTCLFYFKVTKKKTEFILSKTSLHKF